MRNIRVYILFILFNISVSAFAQTDIYISPTGQDSNDGLSAQTPIKSFSKVLEKITPGSTVYVMPGQYTSGLALKPEHSGTKDKYIIFKAYNSEDKPLFYYGGNNKWNCIDIQASYVIIDGLELEGYNQSFDQTSAKSDSLAAYSYSQRYHEQGGAGFDWSGCAKYNTNAISIGKGGKDGGFPHHVTIQNCKVHDFPGGGIGSQQSDWITIENNEVYNCAWYCMYACSGISILNPYNCDNIDNEYKIRVVGNTVYNNHTKIPWCTSSNFRLSDGNGIIIDVNVSPDNTTIQEIKTGGAYRGKTLVANNVSYYNGGSGIHAFKAANVDIINNTSYYNEQRYDGEYGEIFSQLGRNNRIVNNIMFARTNHSCNNYVGDGGGTYDHNLYFGGKYLLSATDSYGDPAFVIVPRHIGDNTDFHLLAMSKAIGAGISTEYMPLSDKDGIVRGAKIDVGAYCANSTDALIKVCKDIDSDTYYNLLGKRITSFFSGFFIVNGKKVYVE